MTTNNYFGLTLSERLNQSGFAHQFTQAVNSGNTSIMVDLLVKLAYSTESAQATAATFRDNPNAYKNQSILE